MNDDEMEIQYCPNCGEEFFGKRIDYGEEVIIFCSRCGEVHEEATNFARKVWRIAKDSIEEYGRKNSWFDRLCSFV